MKNNLRITAAQINTTVGDIQGNAEKIIATALHARDEQKSDLVVFPELVLTGYPPEDLLLRQDFHDNLIFALKQIKSKVKNIYMLVCLPIKEKGDIFNAALLLHNGKILTKYYKRILTNHGAFDDKRYFTPGTNFCVVSIHNVKIAITIGEDLFTKETLQKTKTLGAELIINVNDSLFEVNKFHLREQLIKRRAHKNKTPIIYVNAVGGQDDLVFDGGSMVINTQNKITQRAPFFTEDLMPIDIAITPKIKPISKPLQSLDNTEKNIYDALVLGVRDYIEKNNFKGALVGVSGGIDSALTLAIAVDAVGKDRVETIYLPSRYSSDLSGKITKKESAILGVKHSVISIDPIFQAYLNNLPQEWKHLPQDATEENIQARCRGVILMAFSNKKNLLVLSTGNKSEAAVGYATLYGDMVGGFCVLKDIYKTLVYRLAKYRNQISPVIPEEAITRAPSAELAPNQKDSDSLPPYQILDEILERYIEHDQSIKIIASAGFGYETVKKIVHMVNRSEYKRRQGPPGIKITTKAFGRERRFPITNGFDK